jgi:hypothetical protein
VQDFGAARGIRHKTTGKNGNLRLLNPGLKAIYGLLLQALPGKPGDMSSGKVMYN